MPTRLKLIDQTHGYWARRLTMYFYRYWNSRRCLLICGIASILCILLIRWGTHKSGVLLFSVESQVWTKKHEIDAWGYTALGRSELPIVGNGRLVVEWTGRGELKFRNVLMDSRNDYPVISSDSVLDFDFSAFADDPLREELRVEIFMDRLYGWMHRLCHRHGISFRVLPHRKISALCIFIVEINELTTPTDVEALERAIVNTIGSWEQHPSRQSTFRYCSNDERACACLDTDQQSIGKNLIAHKSLKILLAIDSDSANASQLTFQWESKTLSELQQSNDAVFDELWSLIPIVELSKAPRALNQRRINDTIYRVLSLTDDSVLSTPDNSSIRWKTEAVYDNCYHHFTTMDSETLWVYPKTLEEYNELVKLWMISLLVHGCKSLLSKGTIGLTEAITLSIGSFLHTGRHVEMNLPASSVIRSLAFRGLSVVDGCRVDVVGYLDEDDRPMLHVHASGERDLAIFACDGGCDVIKDVSKSKAVFQVKTTIPESAILYLGTTRNHLIELKKALHVRHISIVDRHSYNVISLHRHGHRMGGLPKTFWVIIIGMVVAFHAILMQLIYREVLSSSATTVHQDAAAGRRLTRGSMV